MHYFQFNIGDYASHTRHLTLMEDLAYRRLLDLYYMREGCLVGDVAAARQVTRTGQGGDGLCRRRRVQVGDHHPGAMLGKEFGRGKTQAPGAGRAGDDGGALCEQHVNLEKKESLEKISRRWRRDRH